MFFIRAFHNVGDLVVSKKHKGRHRHDVVECGKLVCFVYVRGEHYDTVVFSGQVFVHWLDRFARFAPRGRELYTDNVIRKGSQGLLESVYGNKFVNHVCFVVRIITFCGEVNALSFICG